MTSLPLDELSQKIRDVVDLVAALRSENAALRGDLAEMQRRLAQKERKAPVSQIDSEAVARLRMELSQLREERKVVKRKVSNVLKKLESIKLQDATVQPELFQDD